MFGWLRDRAGLEVDRRRDNLGEPLPKRSLYIERPCIGCLRPFKRWDVDTIQLSEQFCTERCKRAFHRGYGIGINLRVDMFDRFRGRTSGREWWR